MTHQSAAPSAADGCGRYQAGAVSVSRLALAANHAVICFFFMYKCVVRAVAHGRQVFEGERFLAQRCRPAWWAEADWSQSISSLLTWSHAGSETLRVVLSATSRCCSCQEQLMYDLIPNASSVTVVGAGDTDPSSSWCPQPVAVPLLTAGTCCCFR